ncbi:MAG: ATP-binding cassette domain-containing protein [Desulfobacterales bacterium]|jgi:oligopeptide transport system ATP-binding protein
MAENKDLIVVENLKKHFRTGSGFFKKRKTIFAVNGLNFTIRKKETLGLVGESGCGKSTTGETILQLYRPTEGKVLYGQQDLSEIRGGELRKYRRKMQIIFQDPFSSLDPRMTVGNIIGEALRIHKLGGSRKERLEKAQELLNLVNLNPNYINRYPHEFSGGQRQRIGIARALAVAPEFIVCDEPISALDVSIQAQIVNLLEDLQDELGLTYLFIAHDLSMVRHISTRVAVMYLGKIVELTPRDNLYENAQHPYTKALLSAVPIPDPFIAKKSQAVLLKGDVTSPMNPPKGCCFNTRCPQAQAICTEIEPGFREIYPSHYCACHLVSA